MQGDDTAPVADTSPSVSDSPASTPSVSESSSDSTAAPAAESKGEQSKETLLDAVLKVHPPTPEDDVLESKEAEETPSSEDKPEGEVKAEDEASEEAEDVPDDEQVPETVPAQTRKKINKLLRERRTLRDEVAQLKQPAEIGAQLQNYAEANNLSSEDVVFSLDLAAMVARGDYEGFYKVISPLIRHAQEVTGVVLPPDVQQMVDQQQMTPQAAREYAKARLDNQRHQAESQRIAQQYQTRQTQHVAGEVQRSVAALEQRFQANDPDYKAKADMVRRTAQAMLAERGNQITSAQEALQITQRAYDEVNNQFRRLQPTMRATAPTPGMSNHQTASARPAPKNLMEAALQGLAKSRAG